MDGREAQQHGEWRMAMMEAKGITGSTRVLISEGWERVDKGVTGDSDEDTV